MPRSSAPPASRRATPSGGSKGSLRGTHPIDRALHFRSLAEQHGLTVTALARRVRRSKGYVSLHLRLAAAVAGMEPAEQAAMRHPAVTWRLVQRVVRGDTRVQTEAERRQAVIALRQKLRDAVGGFSSETVDGRRHRKGRAPGAPQLERFDPRAFATDPGGYVAAHLDALVRVHEAVARQALQSLDLALLHGGMATLPLTLLHRLSRAELAAMADRSRTALTAEQQAALDALSEASRVLAELRPIERRARASRALAADDGSLRARQPPHSPRAAPPPTSPSLPALYDIADLEADLTD